MNKNFAERLTELRKKAGYSQEELADKIGVSRQAISKWECADSSPDTDNLIALAGLYGVSIDELINGKTARTDVPIKDEENFEYSDDGVTVSLGKNEIFVSDGEGGERKYDTKAWENKVNKEKRVSRIVTSVFSFFVVAAYLILGFCLKDGRGWSEFWVMFILIPVASSFVEFGYYKRVAAINFPCIVTAIYCFIGMSFGIWHPTWIVFVLIPPFYLLAGVIDKETGRQRKERQKRQVINRANLKKHQKTARAVFLRVNKNGKRIY